MARSKKMDVEKKVEKKEEKEESKRSFKVKLPGYDDFDGRFIGKTPYQAANKAFSRFFRAGKNADLIGKNINFTIKESTRVKGGVINEYEYDGVRLKVDELVEYPVTVKGVVKTIVKKFKNKLKKVKKVVVNNESKKKDKEQVVEPKKKGGKKKEEPEPVVVVEPEPKKKGGKKKEPEQVVEPEPVVEQKKKKGAKSH